MYYYAHDCTTENEIIRSSWSQIYRLFVQCPFLQIEVQSYYLSTGFMYDAKNILRKQDTGTELAV